MATASLGWVLIGTSLHASDAFHSVDIPLKTPRNTQKGGKPAPLDRAEFGLWIPEGLKPVRGLMFFPAMPAPGITPELKQSEEMCRNWGFATLQTNLNGVDNKEFGSLLTSALEKLAAQSGHPELVHLPFCTVGMSRGGGWARAFARLFPERTIAVASVCLAAPPDEPALHGIPFLTVFGEKDLNQMPTILAELPVQRQEGARWTIAVQWARKHEFGKAHNFVLPFFDEAIRRRMPSGEPSANGPTKLLPYPENEVWLGDVSSWAEKQRTASIFPAAEFSGNPSEATWLPGRQFAATWKAFVSSNKKVKIIEPPGLGDNQPFVLHSADQPISIKVQAPPEAISVKLYNADTLLAEKKEPPHEFAITLSSGIHPIYAVADLPNQASEYSYVHALVVRAK